MHMVLVKIIEEYSKSSKLHVPIIDDNYMIPTKENDYSYLKYENNPQENVCVKQLMYFFLNHVFYIDLLFIF